MGIKKLVQDSPPPDDLIGQPFKDPQLEAERQRVVKETVLRNQSTNDFIHNISNKAGTDVLKNGLTLASDIIGKISNLPGLGPEVGWAGRALGFAGENIPDFQPLDIEAEREKLKQKFRVS